MVAVRINKIKEGEETTLFNFFFCYNFKKIARLNWTGSWHRKQFFEKRASKKKKVQPHTADSTHRYLSKQAKQVSTWQRTQQGTVRKSNTGDLMKP